MDYKDTLLLPKTDFPMRGNLPQNEPKRYKKWFEEDDIYKMMVDNRKDAKSSFTLHDGPPYANGNIHIGHALNKILKDIVIKSQYFQGKSVRFTPGWDCHGLPIEQQVEKKLGGAKKAALPITKVRELCRQHATKFVTSQSEEFKSLGIIADWKKPYLTQHFSFEANIYRTLCQIATNGLLVQRSKPVYWSWAAKTALAEAEVEYEEKEDFSIFVAFDLQNAKELVGVDAKVIIWTTTPWTLPANMGISLNPDEEYVLTSDNYIVAKALHGKLVEDEVISGEIVKNFPAATFDKALATNPLNGRDSLIMLGNHVTTDGGTGCVHTAPGHGEDDYRVSLKYDLDVIMPVDDGGLFDQSVKTEKLLPNPDDFIGMHIFKANEPILELLGDALLKVSKFRHSYPFCWRTHKPLIYRATKQWFVSINDTTNNLQEKAIKELADVKFHPEVSRNRISSMVENRPDWCISRQRDWGVPIAFFIDKNTGKPVFDEKVMNFTAMIFEQKGTDAWWDLSIEELLYPGSGYKAEDLEKTMDILDVWFDSGSTWNTVLKSRDYDSGSYPADMYLEGSDQHRGWFQSSLLISTAVTGHAPYKNILTHGFTVDKNGHKMSKSKGNVISPLKVAKEYGVEIIRLWVGMSDYKNDLKIGDDILKQTAEQYRKIRNTLRFLLANTNDLEKITPIEELNTLDKWIVSEASKVFTEAWSDINKYDFNKAIVGINYFLTVTLSGIHMDISKDRLYCNAKNDPVRTSAQSAMAIITKELLVLLAPVLTYTVDEILEYAPKIITGDAKNVLDLVSTPIGDVRSDFDAEYMIEARNNFFEVVDKLKKEKLIKSTLELELVTTTTKLASLSQQDKDDWFMVSSVVDTTTCDIVDSFTINDDTYKIIRSQQAKCPRCWKQKSENQETLCQRCADV